MSLARAIALGNVGERGGPPEAEGLKGEVRGTKVTADDADHADYAEGGNPSPYPLPAARGEG